MTGVALDTRAGSRSLPLATLTALAAATAAAWVVLAGRMAGMYTGPGGDPGELAWFVPTWALMTAAMMLPATAPKVLHLTRARPAHRVVAATLFLAAYGAVWMAAGLFGYGLVQGVRALDAGVLGWAHAGRWLAAAALLAAAAYQLTPLKRRWLARCTDPRLPRPRPGVRGALAGGLEHGGCCVACCWNLMAALYALGMMSLAWMAALTVLIAAERLLPRPALASRAVAVLLAAVGLAVAAAPASVPALTVPAGAHQRSMTMGKGMGMGMAGG